jgi:hypothetical protein
MGSVPSFFLVWDSPVIMHADCIDGLLCLCAVCLPLVKSFEYLGDTIASDMIEKIV